MKIIEGYCNTAMAVLGYKNKKEQKLDQPRKLEKIDERKQWKMKQETS